MAIDRDDASHGRETAPTGAARWRDRGIRTRRRRVSRRHRHRVGLGDLYGRAGKAPQAVAQFMRLGDHFLKEGVQAKAAASYRKVIKLDPITRCAAAAGRGLRAAGQLVDAKTHLQSAIDKRKARGDQDGADTLAIRLASTRTTSSALQAAKIRIRTGQVVTADLLALAQELDARKRTSEAEEAARGSGQGRSGRHRGGAAPGQGRARPRRSGPRQALPARDARQQGSGAAAHGGKILLKLDNLDAARDHLERFLAVAPRRRGSRALGEHLASPNARYAIVDLLVDHAARPATSARRRAGCRASWRRRRAISRRCCGWWRSASTAISTRR